MASRRSQYVLCPFYKADDPLRIKCEGFDAKIVSAHNIFRLRQDCDEWMVRYCYDQYKACHLYRIILQQYED